MKLLNIDKANYSSRFLFEPFLNIGILSKYREDV